MKPSKNQIGGSYDAYIKDACVCQYCGFDGKRSKEDWAQLQIDHLIPRKIALEHQNHPLNKVVSCYYCNTQKKNFDPSQGAFKIIQNEKTRAELIEKVKNHLCTKKEWTWRRGGGFRKSFDEMMKNIS